MMQKTIVVDARGHLFGRLASVVAKELLSGQSIVIVRCEETLRSGSFYRNKLRYLAFLRKTVNTNPLRGPQHLRAPSKMLWRAIRGMIPHKGARGKHALARLKVFEGIPPPYDKMKRQVVPAALAVTKLTPQRKVTRLGRLSHEMGWKQQAAVATLEAKRKVRSASFYKTKQERAALVAKAKAIVDQKKIPILEEYGYQ
eukprot:TRINITY_DN8929_c0_g1_i1.p1 TRINITY_DN8929_c0_g1~~TRINITY_DN8929_c0_g1_i1.p1  ORF type:complete len:199 (+),score=83.42 TRINITY_DN8929_c0_g1_i1:156-752(+)